MKTIKSIEQKLSKEQIATIKQVSFNLGVSYQNLLFIIDLESAGTFSPSITNSLGYVGLIQFGEPSANELGTTRSELKTMSFDQQMVYVEKYFRKKAVQFNKGIIPRDFVNLYLLVFYPSAVKYTNLQPIGTKSVWDANKGFKDANGQITKKSIADYYYSQYKFENYNNILILGSIILLSILISITK